MTNARTPDGARSAALNMSGAEFRAAGHALVDRIADFLDGWDSRPVTTAPSPLDVRELISADQTMPREGQGLTGILDSTADALFTQSLHNGHPRFMGYITSSAAPAGMLADLLASALNPNCGAWTLSPVPSEIEAQTVRWISELLGYPTDCGGIMVSGGNMANMVGFWAARVAAGGDEIRSGGQGDRRLAVYASAETHTWVQKATDLSGMGTDAVRWIPTGADLRMDLEALTTRMDQDIAAGWAPMMVVGTAGSVMTGAIDDLEAISRICGERDCWFHIDGAYGGFAAMLPEAPAALRHIGLADSVAVDPHKWLYAPLEAGCALVKDPQRLRDAFSYHPPYYHFGIEATNFVDFGPQNSRGFRALKVWTQLRQVGRAGYEQMIGDDIALAQRLHENAVEHEELETGPTGLSIATFRYVPPRLQWSIGEEATEEYLNQLNREVQTRLERGGEVFLSNAVVGGRYLLRGCIVNFRTDTADVDAIPGIVVRVGREVDEEMNGEVNA